jgi:signal transduction histidine kinase
VFLVEYLFKGIIGYKSLIVSILYAFVIALFFTPVKNRIQHLADKIFLGKDPIEIARENELMRQELERSQRLKAIATFASGMAHEIKNPLTAIKTFTEYLPEKTEDKEFLSKFSRIIGTEVNRINSLVHQLLDFAKPAPLNLQTVDIHSLLDGTLNLLSNNFIEHKIKIVKEFYTDNRRLEDADSHRLKISDHLCMKADPNKLKQAFLNLFLNAIEAMPSGGTLTIKTAISNPQSMDHGQLTITISDTGCGISAEDLKYIFEPFYSKKEGGTGLGLSIVYNIIKEHKGEIKVESKINQGTKFIIELPKEKVDKYARFKKRRI